LALGPGELAESLARSGLALQQVLGQLSLAGRGDETEAGRCDGHHSKPIEHWVPPSLSIGAHGQGELHLPLLAVFVDEGSGSAPMGFTVCPPPASSGPPTGVYARAREEVNHFSHGTREKTGVVWSRDPNNRSVNPPCYLWCVIRREP